MAKVTDLRINISENGEKIQFETPVNVTKEGIFTTTIPRNAVDEIEKYGVTLRTNRLGNPGYFEAKTLDELTMSVKKVCREALSRELVEDKIIITSLQQEQPPTENEIAEAHRYSEMIRERDKARIQQQPVLPGIEDPGIPGKDFIPVEWVDACEMYGKWKIVQQEQPEVDLEKEANECWDYVFSAIGWDENSLMTMNHKEFLAFAHHFYELGHNARKEGQK